MFLNGRYRIQWGLQMAGLAVATIPPLLIYIVFQRQFIRGRLTGALKTLRQQVPFERDR